jgi:CheY-like chemotaxis protein
MNKSNLQFIFAEDEEVFREIAVPSFSRAGIPDAHTHVVENGKDAVAMLERLTEGGSDPYILMVLDVRMPIMDGNQAAAVVQQMNKEGKVKRPPFVVQCSAATSDIHFTPGDPAETPFQVTLKKPFGHKELELCLERAATFWGSGSGSGSDNSGAVQEPEVIVADDQPVCQMAITALLSQCGITPSAEPDEVEDMVAALTASQSGDTSRPLVLFLGNSRWKSDVTSASLSARQPYLVAYGDGDHSTFHSAMPQPCKLADVREALEKAKAWFSSRH